MGWNDGQDDWLLFTVNVTETAYYSLKVSAANGRGEDGINNSGFAFVVDDGPMTEKFVYGESNGWDTYLNYELPNEFNMLLTEGEHKLKVYFYGTNADFLRFTKLDPSGIENISADGQQVEYYDLNGVRTNSRKPGVYVVKTGNQVNKVVVK